MISYYNAFGYRFSNGALHLAVINASNNYIGLIASATSTRAGAASCTFYTTTVSARITAGSGC